MIPQSALPRRGISAISLLAVLSLALAACSSSPSPTHSTNAPPTPSTIKTPSSFQHLGAINFTSASSGYGFFESGQGAQCQGLVGSTSNGGRNFGVLASVNTWTCNAPPPANQLAADGHGNVFLYGPALYVSHDSGKTWKFSLQAGAVVNMSAAGNSIWMLQAGCKLGTSPGALCPLHLLESSDGGTTWKAGGLPTSPLLTTSFAQELSQGPSLLTRTGPTSALLLAAPMASSPDAVDYATFWSTTDSGATWTTEQLPCGIGASSAVLATAPGALYAVCAGPAASGQQEKSVVRSTNGGKSWVRLIACTLPNPQPAAACRNGALIDGYLGSVVPLSGTTLYLAGNRSPLVVSHDKGATWNTVTPLIGNTTAGTAGLAFFNKSHGVVLALSASVYLPSAIWSTSNGGSSWQEVVPRATLPTTTGSTASG